MECESCEKRESEVDALIDGAYKRLCRTCAQLEGAVIVERPARNNVMESYKRSTVKEILTRMSGMQKSNRVVVPQTNNLRSSPIQTNRVMIGGKKKEEEYPSNYSNDSVVSNFPKRAQMAQQTETPIAVQALEAESQSQKVQPRRGFFSKLFNIRSNEPGDLSPTSGPSLPPVGGLSENKKMADVEENALEL